MANLITHKKSSVAGKVPVVSDLSLGELAVNTYDGYLFLKKNVGGTETVIKVGPDTPTEVLNKILTVDGTGSGLDADLLDGYHAATTNTANTVVARNGTGLINTNGVQLDTSFSGTSAVGLLSWDADAGTARIGLAGGNATLQIGQEEVTPVYNNTAAALTDMQVVRVTGSQGNNLTVALAQANSETNSANSLAVVTEPIAIGTTGFATRGGVIHNIDTSAYTEGAALWLSPTVAGGVTTIKPTAPNHLVLIGWVVRSHASVGQIFVHIQNGYELDELHDVLINGKASGHTLIYDAVLGVWKNASISGSTNVTVTNGAGTITLSLPSTISVNTTGTAANVTGTIAIANGGTGATTVSQAQTNLEVDPAGTAFLMALIYG